MISKKILPSIFILIAGLFLGYNNLFAAELNFELVPNTSSGDKSAIINIKIDPQTKNLNVIEGSLIFKGQASADLSVQVENGNSILPLWPTPPQYNEKDKAINFVGGIPDGFNKEGLLFRLAISTASGGNLDISYNNGNAYLNDGMGTIEQITSKPLTLNLEPAEGNQTEGVTAGYKLLKNVILFLVLAAVLFVIYRYVYKKNINK